MKSLRDEYFELFERIDFEKIQDHPNILIAARFWDDERYTLNLRKLDKKSTETTICGIKVLSCIIYKVSLDVN